jgi:hypothetical protein
MTVNSLSLQLLKTLNKKNLDLLSPGTCSTPLKIQHIMNSYRISLLPQNKETCWLDTVITSLLLGNKKILKKLKKFLPNKSTEFVCLYSHLLPNTSLYDFRTSILLALGINKGIKRIHTDIFLYHLLTMIDIKTQMFMVNVSKSFKTKTLTLCNLLKFSDITAEGNKVVRKVYKESGTNFKETGFEKIKISISDYLKSQDPPEYLGFYVNHGDFLFYPSSEIVIGDNIYNPYIFFVINNGHVVSYINLNKNWFIYDNERIKLGGSSLIPIDISKGPYKGTLSNKNLYSTRYDDYSWRCNDKKIHNYDLSNNFVILFYEKT